MLTSLTLLLSHLYLYLTALAKEIHEFVEYVDTHTFVYS